MKKLLSILLLLVMLLSLFSCGENTETETTEDATTETTEETTTEEETTEPQETVFFLVNDQGKAACSLVRVYSSNSDVSSAPATIRSKVLEMTGTALSIVTSSEMKEGEHYIIIGTFDSLPETTEILADKKTGNYGYVFKNGNMYIYGSNDVFLEKAVNQVVTNLTIAKDTDGSVSFNMVDVHLGLNDVYLENVPTLGTGAEFLICGDSTYMETQKRATKTTYDEFCQSVTTYGFTLTQENQIGNNYFATYQREDGQIVVSLETSAKYLKAIYQSYHNTVAPNYTAETYTKICDPTIAVLSLTNDASGMSFVVTLPDGRYIVIDGAYGTDATGLYNFLVDNNKREGDVTIAAWILTHDHGDHIACFKAFATAYGKKVNCEYLISNSSPTDYEGCEAKAEGNLIDLDKYEKSFKNGDTKVIKPHAGQYFYFDDVKIEMYSCFELIHPRAMTWLNETSLCFKMYIAGQTFLVTADLEQSGLNVVNSTYGTALKSDIQTVNHHGWTAIPVEFFTNVGAFCALWPTGKTAYEEYTTAAWRNGLYYNLLQTQWTTSYAGYGEVEILTLPFHQGDAIQTYTMKLK